MKKPFIATMLIIALAFTCFGLGVGAGSAYMGAYLSSVYEKENVIDSNEFAKNELTKIEETYAPAFVVSSAVSSTASDAVAVVKGTANSVVSINVVQNTTVNYGYWQVPRQTNAAGSGVIFSSDSEKIYILTNYHVIERATDVTISIDDESTAVANLVGYDSKSDLAVISVTRAALKSAGITDYTVAAFGDSSKLEVGERVVAIGNAYGEGKSATQGIISALNKQISTSDGNTLNVIQTDAAINPGNSGGALVNASSQVIGINTAKLSDFGVEGMGYSIPSNAAKAIVEKIVQNKQIKEPYLGISSGVTVTEAIKTSYNFPTVGVYVGQVVANSPAANAGLRAGDLITSFGGEEIKNIEELTAAIAKTKVGDKVNVVIYRNAKESQTITVTIGERPTQTQF